MSLESSNTDNKTNENINYGTKAIEKINNNIKNGNRFFSFEYYPPRTEKGVISLKKRLSSMIKWNPQWMDVTWGAGGTTSDLTPDICNYIQNNINGNAMMHLTCTNMPSKKVDIALKVAKELGFKNILALRGDPPEGQKEWKAIDGGFKCALDLIKYIKKKYGDYFGITVSGYPEGHPVVRKIIDDKNWNSKTNEPKYWAPKLLDNGKWEGVSPSDWKKELNYLKQKINAGGQVIITQLFYDENVFIEWVKAVRNFGIKVPILPGIMPIRNYGLFCRMTGFCKTVVPKELTNNLIKLKDDNDKLYEYGMNYVSKMCINMLLAKDNNNKYIIPGLHIYTMNQEKPTIELISKCFNYFDFKNKKTFKQIIDNELKRVLFEDKQKKLEKEKEKKEAENNKLQTNCDAIQKEEFKPVTTF